MRLLGRSTMSQAWVRVRARNRPSRFSGEVAPLLHPMNWSVKRRYDTISGRSRGLLCVTLRIIWPNFLRDIWHIGAGFILPEHKSFRRHFEPLFLYSIQSVDFENSPQLRSPVGVAITTGPLKERVP
jgi:hypothetical protein